MKKLRGRFDELVNATARTDDYVQITLTDEDDIPNAMSRLQAVYKNALDLRYDNARTRAEATIYGAEDMERKTPFELFAEFFQERNNAEMSEIQQAYLKNLIEQLEEEDA